MNYMWIYMVLHCYIYGIIYSFKWWYFDRFLIGFEYDIYVVVYVDFHYKYSEGPQGPRARPMGP